MSAFYDVSTNIAFKANEINPRHSEGSVIELKDKSLLLAWQCFEFSSKGSEDSAPATISLANSYDNGATWTNRRVVAAMKDNCVNCYSPAFLRANDGSIVLFFKRYTQFQTGKQILNNLYRITSYDEGKTWSEEVTVWENSTMGHMNHGFVHLHDGSLLLPVGVNEGANSMPDDHESVAVLRSEDEFKSFTKSNVITVPLRGLMEPAVAERHDGVLNMVMRVQQGRVYYSESFDGGRTWTEAAPTVLEAPESCPYILSIPNTEAQIVIWNNSKYDPDFKSHFGKRSPLTLAISRDGLKTFTDYFDIETDPEYAFTNPSAMVTSDGLYVLNYWACKYSDNWAMKGGIDLKIATFRVKL